MLTEFLFENCRLKSDQIFNSLTPSEYNLLMNSSVTHRYRKGEVIFRESGIPTGIFHVKSGLVKKYKPNAKGGEQIFYVCSTGELLGYHALLSEEYYSDSAATMDESDITFIPKEPFMQIVHQSNSFSVSLLKALGHEFSLFLNHIHNLGTRTVRERLAFNLLLLEDKFRPLSKGKNVQILMSRTDLANIVGTAKETLVRLLLEFSTAKLISKTDKTITILNRAAIIREANLRGLH